MEQDIFERGTRLQVRFESPKGLLTIEDLWSLPLTSKKPDTTANLDSIAVDLYMKVQNAERTVSFVTEASRGDKDESLLRFNIVKHIIDVRKAEAAAEADRTKRREQNQRILSLIEQKEGDALSQKSVEELRAMLRGD